MQLVLGAEEALAILTATGALPSAVREPRLVDDGLDGVIDLASLPDAGAGLKLAALLVGAIPLRVRSRGLVDGLWSFGVVAEVPRTFTGSLPDAPGMLVGFLRDGLALLGAAVRSIEPGDGVSAHVTVDAQALLKVSDALRIDLVDLVISPAGVTVTASAAPS